MANQEHLNILLQGARVWNKWRIEHPEIIPDLSWFIFKEVFLPKYFFEVTPATWNPEPLIIRNYKEAARFRIKLLDRIDLSRADLFGADLSNINLTNANLSYARLVEAKFIY